MGKPTLSTQGLQNIAQAYFPGQKTFQKPQFKSNLNPNLPVQPKGRGNGQHMFNCGQGKQQQSQSDNYAGISDAQSLSEGAETSVQEFYDQTCGLFNSLYALAQQQEEALLTQYKTADKQYSDPEGDPDIQEQDYQENE